MTVLLKKDSELLINDESPLQYNMMRPQISMGYILPESGTNVGERLSYI